MEKEFTEGDAFVAAYSEYFGVVYKEALKYSGNHHIAEEIAQDAFFTAYIQCGSESKQQIKIWMLMFACKFCSNGTPILKSAVHSF